MHLQALHPISHSESWTAGEVVVDSTAVVAPGVLLQADPGCRIKIGPGAVIGMGTVVHARDRGAIEIGAGVKVGTAVLLIGRVTVGDRACLGAQVTVMNTTVMMGQTVAPGEVLGIQYKGPSPRPDVERSPEAAAKSLDDASKAWNTAPSDPPAPSPTPPKTSTSPPSPAQPPDKTTPSPAGGPMAQPMTQGVVYGKVQLERLMLTMFPHRNVPLDQNSGWEGNSFNNDQDLSRDEWAD